MSRVSYLFFLVLFLLFCHVASNDPSSILPLDRQHQGHSSLAFSTTWQILGPFQIGTREATWGADPLEYSGGFRQLQYDENAEFRSSLPSNGNAKWQIINATQTSSTASSANASLSVSYSNVDWDFLKLVYGWAAVQYQAWARGEITVTGNETQSVILYTDAILEFRVDGVDYFGGDFYTYRKAPPVLHLTPGTHEINVRLVRDVRAFGGILKPTIDVLLDLRATSGTLELAKPGILVSDMVDGKLASPIASVTLRNTGENDIEIVSIQPVDVRTPVSLHGLVSQVVLAQSPPALTCSQTKTTSFTSAVYSVTLVAGQTRPVDIVSLPAFNASLIYFTITYKAVNGDGKLSFLHVSQNLTKRSTYDPHKVTYLHPGGMVSYAMLRAPAKNATCSPGKKKLPILLALHGAGLEADNGIVAHALDPVADLCSWVLFPTGVTPWSGDDWHNWGFTDVEAAVNSIPSWIEHVGWQGPDVNINRWIVTGHSNGGQGTWFSLTHRPDRIVAAAPISGYASIQKYVSYELWQPMDPKRTSIISGSLNSYRHEMLMENPKGIPILQQHGQIDDNVPAYNSRLLSQQLFQAGTNSSYNEVPGQNHWWDTVMTTPQLVDFYHKQTASNDTIPRRLSEFSFVVGDPGDMGSKGGITVTHLEDAGQYGKVYVKGRIIRTVNILGLDFDPQIWAAESVTVDGKELELADMLSVSRTTGSWMIGTVYRTENDTLHRSSRQLGAMTAILRTRGPFIIHHQGNSQTAHIALQVSRNLHQYFYADSIITSAAVDNTKYTGNVITVTIGEAPPSLHPDFPIHVNAAGVSVRDSRGGIHGYTKNDTGRLGAAFLRPLKGERLELVLWGTDDFGLAMAARLVPMLTGVGQPDFVVLGESAAWRGVEGALSLGFFDHEWGVTASSVLS
ncbi:hypothetical protein K504DRAFT_475829 [Pleomassaria siparia CBS 279.74]|uniref:Peptidase S9 prolyl oligopeptidase catalytic domain-containing protein n=1 Tax=Pleomassaria siparia CBS 279.74 TaxID=1314801 RepID=A0A6G1KDP4_9PLEO|nr:hypothetical protein K504DRAFT_475829 [Pleomassaria siparia CBS 279.74]